MRYLLAFLLVWSCLGAVVPDARAIHRDDGAPPLPGAPPSTTGSSILPPTVIPKPLRTPKPSGTPSTPASPGPTSSHPATPNANSGTGGPMDPGEGAPGAQPLPPVTTSALRGEGMPWYLIVLGVLLLIGTIALGMFLGRSREGPGLE